MISMSLYMWKKSNFTKFDFAKSLSQLPKKFLHTLRHVDFFFLIPTPLWNGKFFFQACYQSLNKHEGLGQEEGVKVIKKLGFLLFATVLFPTWSLSPLKLSWIYGTGLRLRSCPASSCPPRSHPALAGARVTHALDSSDCQFRPWLQN